MDTSGGNGDGAESPEMCADVAALRAGTSPPAGMPRTVMPSHLAHLATLATSSTMAVRAVSVAALPTRRAPMAVCARFASSSSPASSSTASPLPPSQSPSSPRPAPSATPSSQEHHTITWPEYFKLRKSRSRFGTMALVPTVPLALGTSGSYFLTSEVNPLQPLFGLDPTIVAIAATLASGFGGYLIGPVIGNGLWSLLHQKQRRALEIKDADFYEHVSRNRVDPNLASIDTQNRIPDFYGEKIYSLADYRKWLRDCAEFRRKAAHGVKKDEESQMA
ncbi:unnamed protein product [Parajaminaea phylloscopi]